jgi:hypothetical protein
LEAPTAEGRRPVLPGVSGRNLELLQDAVARKMPHVTQNGSLVAAREVLSEATHNRVWKLNGHMAEAIALDRHPEWKYVNKANASQYDVYIAKPNGGSGNQYVQVKFHASGDPATYARDMIKDNRAKYFAVPDDHVEKLRAYLIKLAEKRRAAGDLEGAKKYYREAARVKGIGATSTEVENSTWQAIAEARVARVAPYVLLGVSAILLMAPAVCQWYRGEITGRQALGRVAKGGSSMLAAGLADQALKHWRKGLLRGTTRGNVIVAGAALLVDTCWQINEHGGVGNAMKSPDFVISFGGRVSATGLALAGGTGGATLGGKLGFVVGAMFGPAGAPLGGFIGATVGGLIGGTVSGMAGFFLGSKGLRGIMAKYFPEFLFQQERRWIEERKQEIAAGLLRLQTL